MQWSQETFLITGGTGFIGSHLIDRLRNLSSQIWLVQRGTTASIPPQQLGIAGVINSDGSIESMRSQIQALSPTCVLHIASRFVSKHKYNEIEDLIESNIGLGTKICELACSAGCKRFLNIDTTWQHLDGQQYNPVNLYAATKKAFSDILYYFHLLHGLRTLTLKLPDIYGPADSRPKLVNLLFESARSGQILEMTAGEQELDLVFVQDVVRGIELAIIRLFDASAPSWEDYSISSRQPIKVKELVSIIEKQINQTLPIRFGSIPYDARQMMKAWNGVRLPGWEPLTDLENGLMLVGRNYGLSL